MRLYYAAGDIYLDDKTELLARKAAEAEGISLSKWIAGVIRKNTGTEWPKDILELAGTWPEDFPEVEELRRNQPSDIERESL